MITLKKSILILLIIAFAVCLTYSDSELPINKELNFSMADKNPNYSNSERNQIPEQYTWKVTDIYPSSQDWSKDRDILNKEFIELKSYRGKISKDAKTLLEVLNKYDNVKKRLGKFSSYANRVSDVDKRVSSTQAMKDTAQKMATDFESATSFLNPEILEISDSTLLTYYKANPELVKYKQFLDNITRKRKNILSKEQEKILAEASLISSGPENIYSMLYNSDMPMPKVTLSDGTTVQLSNSEYSKWRTSHNREDRIKVFDAFWSTFDKLKNTYASMLNEQMKKDFFFAKMRNHPSTLAASLSDYNIPTQVYKTVIDSVHKNFGSLHRYLNIRKKLLGLKDLHYYDLYCPIIKEANVTYDWDECKVLLKEALSPLGKDYVSTLKEGLENRWADIYPNLGKRSGAYSSGEIYDTHPFVLLNYNNDFDGLSTTAHEFGHAIHSYLSNKNQPYTYADYSTFIAEIASTLNEYLLSDYLINNTKDKNVKLFLLGENLERIRTTIFRQTLFAEFELLIHEEVEKGESLTADKINKIYIDLLKKYYGHDKGVVVIDDLYAVEWAFIPHFYYNYYVFQYVTGLISSISLGDMILQNGEKAVTPYLNMLKSGSSKYPIELLKDAGVDFTTDEPIKNSMKVFNKIMDKVEELLK